MKKNQHIYGFKLILIFNFNFFKSNQRKIFELKYFLLRFFQNSNAPTSILKYFFLLYLYKNYNFTFLKNELLKSLFVSLGYVLNRNLILR